jgi:hypothetical protein
MRGARKPPVHALALAGIGKGFYGGYDLVGSAEERVAPDAAHGETPEKG